MPLLHYLNLNHYFSCFEVQQTRKAEHIGASTSALAIVCELASVFAVGQHLDVPLYASNHQRCSAIQLNLQHTRSVIRNSHTQQDARLPTYESVC